MSRKGECELSRMNEESGGWNGYYFDELECFLPCPALTQTGYPRAF